MMKDSGGFRIVALWVGNHNLHFRVFKSAASQELACPAPALPLAGSITASPRQHGANAFCYLVKVIQGENCLGTEGVGPGDLTHKVHVAEQPKRHQLRVDIMTTEL